jgi:hypothetical protein
VLQFTPDAFKTPAQVCPQEPQLLTSVFVLVPPTHGPKGVQVPLLHERVAVPLQLHVSVANPTHVQAPQVQELSHVRVPPVPQLPVEPGAHCCWPVHADHADQVPVVPSQVRVCIPQLPHFCWGGPVHICPPQFPQLHVPPHICMPPLPQLCMDPGAHWPSPEHADHADQVPVLESQVRVWVPQLPHARLGAPVHI